MKSYFFLQKLVVLCLCMPSMAYSREAEKPVTPQFADIDEPGALTFKPPKEWKLANPEDLSPRVKLMIVGKGSGYYPPSINVGTEPYKGTLRDYLRMVKKVNEGLGSEWRDLGTIETLSGKASLSQVDMNTEWGQVRLMHVILVKNRNVYVVTAGALKEEFSKHYNDFFEAFRSIQLNPDVFDLVSQSEKKRKLEQEYHKLLKSEEHLSFDDETFQKEHWTPFLRMLDSEYAYLGSKWKEQTIGKVRRDLTAEYQ